MSYIPPLVCDTPPPIDFEDSHEDDFGDGMFSNYDGKYGSFIYFSCLSTRNLVPNFIMIQVK